MKNHPQRFTAVVLAGNRRPHNPVAEAAGVSHKSLVPVGGKPMVIRVLDSLAESHEVGDRILCGPSKSAVKQNRGLGSIIESGVIRWFENQTTPSASAFHVLQNLPDEIPVMLTTADHALLSPQIVDYFCSEALATGCDVVIGIARHETVTKAYPQTTRTATRLADDAYCGCNLFAFLTLGARQAANFWRQVESQRKKPLRMIGVLGWAAILRYLTRQLTLKEALERISDRLGFRAGAVILPFPEAAIDVDSIGDWKLVEEIISKKQAGKSSRCSAG